MSIETKEAPKIDEMVELYIRLRDRRSKRKAAYDLDDAKDKEVQEEIEARLLVYFEETSVESARTEAGTAYKCVYVSATVADRDTFMAFALEHPDFLESKPNKTAVLAYIEANGELPPGVNVSRKLTVGVRRS